MEIGKTVRETRMQKGITLRRLAKDIGVSPSFISQMEQGKAAPSIDSLTRIAKVLGVASSYLLGETAADAALEPAGRARNKFAAGKFSGVNIKRLVPDSCTDNNLEPALLVLEPGASSQEMSGSGEEFMLVLSGQLEVTISGETYTIREGDNIYFDSGAEHSLKNTSGQTAKILWIKG
jgi:transcriptional regulator with XRE-family HTH domain